MRKLKKGDVVSVKYGLETRVNGRIVSGPHKWTETELEELKEASEYHGYSTKRMCKSYYCVSYGKVKMKCSTSGIKPAGHGVF